MSCCPKHPDYEWDDCGPCMDEAGRLAREQADMRSPDHQAELTALRARVEEAEMGRIEWRDEHERQLLNGTNLLIQRDAALALVERYGKALREIAIEVSNPTSGCVYCGRLRHSEECPTVIATNALSPAAGTSEGGRGGMGGMGKGVGT